MSTDPDRPEAPRRRRALAPVLVLLVALAGAIGLLTTAPRPERRAPRPQAPVVEVRAVEREPFDRVVEAYGTVVAARTVALAPEVEGPVAATHPSLEPGGVIPAGEVLLAIDPSEFDLAVAAAEASLAEAQAALEIERGRQRVAEREWELFGSELPEAERGRALALREPQIRQAEAKIATAAAALDRARLDRARTELRSPFDVLVVSEAVEVGQRVGPQSPVAELVGVDAFWVQVSLPLERLPAVLEAAEAAGDDHAPVRVSLEAGSTLLTERSGRLLRHLGRLEPSGRMAQVLVAVDDPLGRAGGGVLPLGSYVRVAIEAGRIPEAVRIPRSGLRENGELWVADAEDRLRVRRAEVLWRQGDEVAARDVFADGERLIVSPIGTPVPGMELRPRVVGEDG